jgi:hypothetical protein
VTQWLPPGMRNDEQTHTGRASIGVMGLAVTGANIARHRASREGNTICGRRKRRHGF